MRKLVILCNGCDSELLVVQMEGNDIVGVDIFKGSPIEVINCSSNEYFEIIGGGKYHESGSKRTI